MKIRRTPSILTIVVVAMLFLYYAFTSNNPGNPPTTPQPPTPIVTQPVTPGSNNSIGQRTKTADCVSTNALPDSACTPGAIFPDATKEQICTPGYSSQVRNVPDSVKNQAYDEYGIVTHTTGQYEVDHLISLELGGSNDIANLWPEPAEPRPGFHEKDKVENYLHDQVCNGSISLQDAQYKIANDWFTVYQSIP
jgi:hypothetical protein